MCGQPGCPCVRRLVVEMQGGVRFAGTDVDDLAFRCMSEIRVPDLWFR